MKNQKQVGVYFFLNNAKRNKVTGESPIYLRIRLGVRDSSDLSLGYSILKKDWNKKLQIPKTLCDETGIVSDIIHQKRKEVRKVFQSLLAEGQPVSSLIIKDVLTGKAKVKHTFLDVFDLFIDDFETQVKIGKKTSATLTKYRTIKKHFELFLSNRLSLKDISVEQFTLSHIEQFQHFLMEGKGFGGSKISNNTSLKYISHLHSVFKLALNKDWVLRDPFLKFKGKKEEVETVYLNEYEFNHLRAVEIKIKRLDRIRDVFVFSCQTGLAFSDVKKLNKRNIHIDVEDRGKVLVGKRQKTGVEYRVPLTEIALGILNKYKDCQEALSKDELLPVLSNCKYNVYLKELQVVCRFNKELTTHVARHTAATLMLSNGTPIEVVQKVLGHQNIKETQKYARLLPRAVSAGMAAFKSKFSNDVQKRSVKSK